MGNESDYCTYSLKEALYDIPNVGVPNPNKLSWHVSEIPVLLV